MTNPQFLTAIAAIPSETLLLMARNLDLCAAQQDRMNSPTDGDRYRKLAKDCRVKAEGGRLICQFDRPDGIQSGAN